MQFAQDATNDEIAEAFDLPELPETVEDTDEYEYGELAQLCVSQRDDENVYLDGEVLLADAQEYCSREDTHGPGWFVMWYRR